MPSKVLGGVVMEIVFLPQGSVNEIASLLITEGLLSLQGALKKVTPGLICEAILFFVFLSLRCHSALFV
ncbi:hypothetical protein, partial [Coxiella burnetii]|uniref:hypothetical protein n=1 Tax=Coxiella burnetii TaxID=777 RepID=UPI002231342B